MHVRRDDFENGENGSVIDTAPTGSTVYTASSGVPGPYDTECSGGSDNNYDFNYIDGQVDVAKKTIDVTASSHNVTYGDSKPTITCTYDATDFENGENGSVINTAPTGSTVYTATSGVPGPYDTECSGGSDNNYDFNYIDGQVDVAKKAIDVTASSHSVTYGDAKPTVTCSYDNSDFENGETDAVIDTAPTGSTAYNQFDGVAGAPYGTSCAGGSDNNYSFNYSPGNVTVSKAVIDVTASSHTVTYGDPKPNVTCAYDNSDFKGTDDAGDINTPPTGSTTYNQGDDVGTYPTSCAGGADDNYTFNYAPGAGGVGGNAGPGAITVTKKSVSGTFVAADKVYDGNTSATASNRQIVGALAGDTVTLEGGTAAFPNKNVGNDYNVPLSGATLGGADKETTR